MTEKSTRTVVVNVFDDKYCDVYFFTSEQVKLCSELKILKSFESFLIDLMCYSLFHLKQNAPDKDTKSLVREHLFSQFGRVGNMNIQFYLDFPQTYSLERSFSINDCIIDEVFVCDYCIGKLYEPNSMAIYDRKPRIYRANKAVCDIDLDRTFFINEENLNNVISLVIKQKDILESFNDLSLYAVKDDRGIEICPFSVGNEEYFVEKAREHANDKNYLTHKTYVYEYKNGKTNKIYGCVKFRDSINVISLNLEKEDACNKEDKKEEQNNTHEDRIVLITNDERRMIVRALGLLETALNIEEDVCSDDYKESVRELAHVFCEENWMPQYYINSYKVRSLEGV